jgi:ribosomal protein L7/L12
MIARMAMDRSELDHMNRLAGRVARLEEQLALVLRHLNITPPAPPELDDVSKLIAAGDRIGAIALYRKQTGKGLAEAKQAVEELAARLGF